MGADWPGQDADAPSGMPASAWREVWRRALRRASDDGLLTEAAGVAFYAVFALVAGLAAFVSLWGLFAEREVLASRVQDAERILPAGLPELLDQLIASAAPGHGAAALAAALWAASGTAGALLRGLNLAYGERECRGFWRFTGLSLLVTLCGAVFTLLALAAFLVLPSAFGAEGTGVVLGVLRWPVLIAAAVCGLATLYRVGPCRAEPRWRWVSWGGGFAALAWVGGSAGFSWYVRDLGGYGAAYGPLAGIVAFMTWAWLSAAAVLMGAFLNAEAEGQTTRDTTVGAARPGGTDRTAADRGGPVPPADGSRRARERMGQGQATSGAGGRRTGAGLGRSESRPHAKRE
jgi:membrane protein